MTEPTKDERLEGAIRTLLVARRPTDGARAELRLRIDRIPDEVRPTGPLARVRGLGGVAAGFAAAGFAVALIVLVLSGGAVHGPVGGGGSVPTPLPFDPNLEGMGMVQAITPLAYLPWGIALAIPVAAVVWIGLRGWRRIAILGLIGALGVGAGVAVLHPGFEPGSASGPLFGYLTVEGRPGTEDEPAFYETGGPGAPVGILFDVRNPGPLPLTLLGAIRDSSGPGPSLPRWTAVWLARNQNVIGFINNAVAFQPVTVQPGDEIEVFLVGKAGPCAAGSGPTPGANPGGLDISAADVELAYSVLGIPTVETFPLPMVLVEQQRDTCQVVTQ